MNDIVRQVGLHYLFYEGSWQAQKRNGYGVQIFPNGAIYEGNWLNNKAEGFGKLEYVSGLKFEGNFKRNQLVEGTLNI